MSRAKVDQIRVGLGHEVSDDYDLALVGETDRRHGFDAAPHLRARSHARMVDHMRVIHKQARAGQGLMMTLVPTGTSGYSSSESEMYIRMHPWEACVPIEYDE
jgi:hypothetical protein